jgi:hypothetical protein
VPVVEIADDGDLGGVGNADADGVGGEGGHGGAPGLCGGGNEIPTGEGYCRNEKGVCASCGGAVRLDNSTFAGAGDWGRMGGGGTS